MWELKEIIRCARISAEVWKEKRWRNGNRLRDRVIWGNVTKKSMPSGTGSLEKAISGLRGKLQKIILLIRPARTFSTKRPIFSFL